MRTFIKLALALFLIFGLYLFFFPTPISPAPWAAPQDKGYVGDFAPNSGLVGLTEIALPEGIHGPEDIVEMDDDIYVSSQNGWVLKFNPRNNQFEKFAETKGKPLGMEALGDNLILADPYLGLVSIDKSGAFTVLTDSVDGSPILYADDLDVSHDGIIYFSDASTKFGAKKVGSTLAASLLEIMEHGETGRLLAYDPSNGMTRLVADKLSFSNGVARAPNGTSVWVIETGKYRILEIAPDGTRKIIIDNLPGFPDNINRGPDGTYFVGLVSKRADILDELSNKPLLRNIIWRLPAFMKPKSRDYGFVFQLGPDGNVLRSWQDAEGAYPATTGAIVISDSLLGDRLYVSSLASKTLGYRPYP